MPAMRALPQIDYDSHPAYAGLHQEAEARRDEALERLAPMLEVKRRRLEREAEVFFGRRASSNGDSVADALARDGATGVRVDEALLEPLKSAAAPLLQALETLHSNRRLKGKPLKFQHTQTDLCANGEWTPEAEGAAALLEALIARSGVIDLAESYYPGSSARLQSACVRLNTEQQPFFSRGDAAPDPKTIGMHIDSAATASLNGVLYLAETGPDQGAFSYVKGSNHWEWELEDRVIRKAVDESRFQTAANPVFLGLPPELRRRANFGADLVDEAPESLELRSREITFASDVCDMALFDSDGVHRGGNVRSGRRRSILFVMSIEPIKARAAA
jgi:hypothetical protein